MIIFHFCMTNIEENFCHLKRKVTDNGKPEAIKLANIKKICYNQRKSHKKIWRSREYLFNCFVKRIRKLVKAE